MYRFLLILLCAVCADAYPDVNVIVTTDKWWVKGNPPSVLSRTATDPVMQSGFQSPELASQVAYYTDDGVTQYRWDYTGAHCNGSADPGDQVRNVEWLLQVATRTSRPSPNPGRPSAGGNGFLVQCGEPHTRMFLNITVKPIPPKPPAPLSCRLDAAPAIDIVAPTGHTRRPVAAQIVCTGKGQASAVVRTSSPRTVVVADGVTVVLNGQLDESTPVTGGTSFPIDLHVDVENNRGAPGGYSVSYVLTVDLT